MLLFFFFSSVLFFVGSTDAKIRGKSFKYKASHKAYCRDILQNLTVSNIAKCAYQCTANKDCDDANFDTVSKSCQLMTKKPENVMLSLVEKTAFIYLGDNDEIKNYEERLKKIKVSCNTSSALGMEDGRIPDEQLTASSHFHKPHYFPAHGRLNSTEGAWAPETNDVHQWFQVDLGSLANVTGIATQGCPWHSEWMTSYGLQYSADNSCYEDYEGGKSFSGNSDQNTVVKNDVIPAITARYIRVRPKTWNVDIVMRVELYGCK